MTGNAGQLLNIENALRRNAVACPPIGNDAGVIDAERLSCARDPAEVVNYAFNGRSRIHAKELSRCVNYDKPLTC